MTNPLTPPLASFRLNLPQPFSLAGSRVSDPVPGSGKGGTTPPLIALLKISKSTSYNSTFLHPTPIFLTLSTRSLPDLPKPSANACPAERASQNSADSSPSCTSTIGPFALSYRTTWVAATPALLAMEASHSLPTHTNIAVGTWTRNAPRESSASALGQRSNLGTK